MRLRLGKLLRQKEVREGRKITQQELAKALGISQQQVSVLMRENNKQVSLKLLDLLSDYFGVTATELFEGAKVEAPNFPNRPLDANDLYMLPVLGHINAGPLDEEHQEILEYYAWSTNLGARPDCFILNVQGDSMEDVHILPGSRVVIDPNIQPKSGDIVAALVDGDSALKRLYLNDGHAVLVSENREKNYPPIFLNNKDESVVQGVVVSIILTPETRRI
ncbi:MAG: helix-turn-helix domain-containing protein [Candidatus Poribacteria bacterium]|nr:helix-turn-helix domain-containing protein [Candidatus Poribacteria bacterium]